MPSPSTSPPPEAGIPDRAVSPSSLRLARDNAEFAFDILRRRAAQPGNFVLAPHSVSAAIAMVLAGACGETADGISRACRWSTVGPELHRAFADIARGLAPPEAAGRPAYELAQANRLWAAIPTLEPYRRLLETAYSAEPGGLSADPVRAAADINAWVSEATRGRITELVTQDTIAGAVLALTNAVYLKARWSGAFDPGLTRSASFTLDSGQVVQAPTMSASRVLRHAAEPGVEAIRIPFEGGLVMEVLLPARGMLDRLIAALSEEKLRRLWATATEAMAHLELPRFKFGGSLQLRDALMELGASRAFSPQADFSGMAPGPLKVGSVLHAADIAVDEQGCEASGATIVTMFRSMVQVKFIVDRPFLFLLRHEATGAVLFAGRVVDPTA